MDENYQSPLYKRVEAEITNYLTRKIELSDGVFFSQNKIINRIYKFKNRDLTGTKINADLSYDYFFDIISSRADSEIKNLRFDTKHIICFSRNPVKDFPVVFIANASLKSWMAENGEDDKLKASVEEFVANGNVIFKKIKGGYERTDPLNTYVTNQRAETVDDTDLVERHEMTASQLNGMAAWDVAKVTETIKNLGNKTFTSAALTTPIETTGKRYEIFEFTGEVSELEFNHCKGIEGGNENKYFLAKVICSGLRSTGPGERYTLFAEKLNGKMSDHYIDAHRGKYEGRFWRVGMYELLFDHQIRANEIGNQLARGLEWASKSIFHSTDSTVLQNIRADMDNGDVIIAKDLTQLDFRMRNLDQLIADWNRLMADADRLSNSYEVTRGESLPSGTPFRLGALVDANAGKLFTLLRQKITLPYKRVFREWLLPELVKKLNGEDVFRLIGDSEVLDQLREIMAENWYLDNLIKIGPHSKEIADAIKAEKMDEFRRVDPVIRNTKEIWKSVLPRLFITITGENSDAADSITDMVNLMSLETDPERLAFLLDSIYKIRGIPVPPKKEDEPAETQLPERAPGKTAEKPVRQQAKKKVVQQPVIE